ncbi:hypothetical protein EDD22DRAFT_845285 [Suillus occidentalis]|nr:hypothetical protein EDD22DRAFT_845285 [Suillus occidentalis]
MEDGYFEGEESSVDIPNPGDDEQDEQDEQCGHFGVEESDLFELGRNTSSESLIDALDEIDIPYGLLILSATAYFLAGLRLGVIHSWPSLLAICQGTACVLNVGRSLASHYFSWPSPGRHLAISGSNVWLYVPQRPEVLQQLVQLNHEEHAFVTLTNGSYDLVGYLADHHQISPIYCDTSLKQAQPWTNQLDQIGWLAIEGDITQHVLHALFQKTLAGGAHISAINSSYCRPSPLGVPLPMWPVEDLQSASIQFHPAPFPYGYPPPTYLTTTPTAQSMCQVQVPSNNIVESLPSAASSIFELQSMANTDLDYSSYQHWGPSTTASVNGVSEPALPVSDGLTETSYEQLGLHSDLQWRDTSAGEWGSFTRLQKAVLTREMKKTPWWRIVLLTRYLFIGDVWVGQHSDPLHTSPLDVRRLITNSFLTALDLIEKTYEDMLAIPVEVMTAPGQTVSAGWTVFRITLAKTLDNMKGEIRKVIKGSMSTHTNFCQAHNMEERIKYFVVLLNSGDNDKVRRAISELVVHQLFRELLWATLLCPISGLGDNGRHGRVVDLFPEEVLSKFNSLAKRPVCNLLTFLYSTMIMTLREINPGNINYHAADAMHFILLSALDELYANPNMYPEFTAAVMALPFLT